MGFLSELIDSYWHGLERHRNRPFMRATMAASALVSIADGTVSLGDRTRLDHILDTLEALQTYDPHECVDLFNDFVAAIKDDPRKGRARAMEAVLAETAKQPDSARMLIRVCLALAAVGDRIPMVEQIEIVSLSTRLGIEPESVGLYTKTIDEDLGPPAGST